MLRLNIFTNITIRVYSTRKSLGRPSINTKKFPLQLFVDGVELYKNVYGDPWVGNKFVFPANDNRIPQEYKNLPLGSLTKRFRRTMVQPKLRKIISASTEGKRLFDLGFLVSSIKQKSLVCLKSFMVFKELYGHVKVPRTFNVPISETIEIGGFVKPNPWPRAAWGYRLGRKANQIKIIKSVPSIHSKLESIGFSFKKLRKGMWGIDNYLDAIKIYKSIYGNVRVMHKFIVPKDEKYPEEIRGMKLGYLMNVIRNKKSHYAYDKIREASAVDFEDYSPKKKKEI